VAIETRDRPTEKTCRNTTIPSANGELAHSLDAVTFFPQNESPGRHRFNSSGLTTSAGREEASWRTPLPGELISVIAGVKLGYAMRSFTLFGAGRFSGGYLRGVASPEIETPKDS